MTDKAGSAGVEAPTTPDDLVAMLEEACRLMDWISDIYTGILAGAKE